MKEPEQLLKDSLSVINESYKKVRGIRAMAPLFSGGHDSYCACFVASQHNKFDGIVYHIDTGIGSKATRAFVEETCKIENWKLNVLKSHETYEEFIRTFGFPGHGLHGFIYNRIKDRCIDMITRPFLSGRKHRRTVLITGCRSLESRRRMGHVEKIKIGETSKKTGKHSKTHRIWVAPCHDWSGEDQVNFMNYFRLDTNPIKKSLLGMSGECFCGAFARPYELDLIRDICPDVAEEIDRLTNIAKECGKPSEWGKAPSKESTSQSIETGPLCTSCRFKTHQFGDKDDRVNS